MKKMKKNTPKRLIRRIEKMIARQFWQHPTLWGMSKEDVFASAFEKVWESGARTPAQANRAILAALSKCRDEAKHNRSCLQPFQVRKAEKAALKSGSGKDPETLRQAAYREFVEDFALFAKRTAFRESTRRRVRAAIKAMSEKDQEIAGRFLRLKSVKSVAISYGVAPRTYLRREWAEFKLRFTAVWETVDE